MKSLVRPLARLVPYRYRPFLKEKYFDFMLGVDGLLGREYGVVPPVRMNFVGTRHDFLEVGQEFFGYFKNLCSLNPDDRVLDIGSGIGRMAIPLTTFLSQKGSYHGFDLISFGVKWCKNKISTAYPNFYFQQADIHNHAYHPSGTKKAEEYKFPFPDGAFTFAFATSVFTHLMRPATENYLKEVSRVLNKDGRALLTFFFLNPESKKNISENRSNINFFHEVDGAWTNDPQNPEWAIAFDEDQIRNYLNKVGLQVIEIKYGKWSNKDKGLSYQDLLLVKKI